MTKSELRARLLAENISQDLYSLDGGLPGEKLCLSNTGNKWQVYYSERGLKTGLKEFDSEHDACDHFYVELLEIIKYS